MDREEGQIAVFSDISIGSQVTGVGLQIVGLTKKPINEKTCIGPGFSPVEAELIAVIFGMERVELLLKATPPEAQPVKIDAVISYTDCDPVVRAIHDLARFRSNVTKKMVKAIIKKVDEFKVRYGIVSCIRPVRSLENPAHELSREARKRWTELLSSKAAGS